MSVAWGLTLAWDLLWALAMVAVVRDYLPRPRRVLRACASCGSSPCRCRRDWRPAEGIGGSDVGEQARGPAAVGTATPAVPSPERSSTDVDEPAAFAREAERRLWSEWTRATCVARRERSK